MFRKIENFEKSETLFAYSCHLRSKAYPNISRWELSAYTDSNMSGCLTDGEIVTLNGRFAFANCTFALSVLGEKFGTQMYNPYIFSHPEVLADDNVRLVDYIIDMEVGGKNFDSGQTSRDIICYTHMGKPLRPKTQAQKEYVDNIRNTDMVFGIGPAGTGKTYLACALAISAYKNREIERIILTRPAVEAGERLGFLPGDMQEKVDPYLRPLYDALYDVLGMEAAARLREKGVIEVVPLAYMRGRTLDNAFIILDEAQNTTREQMKMFLTRMGFNSKVVVTGDITQIDLPGGTMSGLKEARKVLDGVEGIRFSYFTEIDVVRHELVKRIIKAYESYDNSNKVRTNPSRGGKVSSR